MVEKHDIFLTGVQDKYRVIFPTPQNEEYFDGEYILKENYDTKEHFAFCQAVKNGTSDIKISRSDELDGEEHTITIDENGIYITYATDEGLFRAVTSVRQLIVYGEGKTVPYAKIHDKPQFKHRSYLVCRIDNRMTVKYLKRVADYISELRYNAMHLFIQNTPKGLVYEKFPEIETHPDDLTPEQIREIDNYCAQRHIKLVPAINCFGHLGYWFAEEKYKHLEVREISADEAPADGTLLDVNTCTERTGTLNILHPEAREFVLKLFDSVLPNFSTDIVDIGLDEAYGLGKYQLKDICDEKGKTQVFVDYANEIVELVRERYGKKAIYYTDLFKDLSMSERAKYLPMLPKGGVTGEWGFDTMNIHLIEELCRAKYDAGVEFISVTYSGTYGTIAGRFHDAVNNMRSSAEIAVKYNGYGYSVAIWNCEAYTWELVPAAIGAQYAWNVGHKQHGGWTKGYYVRNAQAFVDKYVFGGAKVSRDICRLADTYLLEPEYSACGSILRLMLAHPLTDKVKKNFYDVCELYDELYIDNIIEYVEKFTKRIEIKDFPGLYKDEILADAKALILAAELMRIRITDKVTREKAEELHKTIDYLLKYYEEFKKEQGYTDTPHLLATILAERKPEIDHFIVD